MIKILEGFGLLEEMTLQELENKIQEVKIEHQKEREERRLQ